MTWIEATNLYRPYKIYFRVVKKDVLDRPHKKNGGVITCLPINRGFSTVRKLREGKVVPDETWLSLGFSSLTGPKAYRIAQDLDSVGIRYRLYATGSVRRTDVPDFASAFSLRRITLLDTAKGIYEKP